MESKAIEPGVESDRADARHPVADLKASAMRGRAVGHIGGVDAGFRVGEGDTYVFGSGQIAVDDDAEVDDVEDPQSE
jgi:hypothetical protein